MNESAGQLLLVDENDRVIGHSEKNAVHRLGLLHRAFSILVFDDAGRTLLQCRAPGKYHCGSLWTNTCCSHPLSGETMADALQARLSFEMGFDCPLFHHHTFTYRADFPETNLIEYEIDHVYTGRFNGVPRPNSEEVMEYRWVTPTELRREIWNKPERFTPWFRLIVERLQEATVNGQKLNAKELSMGKFMVAANDGRWVPRSRLTASTVSPPEFQ